jgi:hypothetical protein
MPDEEEEEKRRRKRRRRRRTRRRRRWRSVCTPPPVRHSATGQASLLWCVFLLMSRPVCARSLAIKMQRHIMVIGIE